MSIGFEVTDSQHAEAKSCLLSIGALIAPHTISLEADGQLIGTAVLVTDGLKKRLITARHVALKLESAREIKLIQKFDNTVESDQKFSTKLFECRYWDPNFDIRLLREKNFWWLEVVKDLAIVELNALVIDHLKQEKTFYNISADDNHIVTDKDVLVTMGVIQYAEQYNAGPFAVVKNAFSYSYDSGIDYIVCSMRNDTYEIKALCMPIIGGNGLRGLSGGGLWKVTKNEKGLHAALVGIDLAQFNGGEAGTVDLVFHGPNSISSFLRKIVSDEKE